MRLHSLDWLCNKVTLIRSFRPSKIALGKKQSRSTYMYIHKRDGTSSGSKGLDVDAPTNLFHDVFFIHIYPHHPTAQYTVHPCLSFSIRPPPPTDRPSPNRRARSRNSWGTFPPGSLRGTCTRCSSPVPRRAAADADNVNIAFYWARALFG